MRKKFNPVVLLLIGIVCLFLTVGQLNKIYSESLIFSRDAGLSQRFSDEYQGESFSLIRVVCKRNLFEPAVMTFISQSHQYEHEVTNDFCLFKLNSGEAEGIYQIKRNDQDYVVSIKGLNAEDHDAATLIGKLKAIVAKAQKRQ